MWCYEAPEGMRCEVKIIFSSRRIDRYGKLAFEHTFMCEKVVVGDGVVALEVFGKGADIHNLAGIVQFNIKYKETNITK